ncbi:MAG: HAMP domain-containing protein, partial [Myxococcota bacterium]
MQVKVVGFLLAIAMVPLAVAAVLIDQTAAVAHNFASNEAAFLRPPLLQASAAYRELIVTKRDLYYRQVALRAASMAAIQDIASLDSPATGPGEAAVQAVAELLATTHELQRVAVVVTGDPGQVLLERRTLEPVGVTAADWRPIELTQPIAGSDATLALTFAADPALQRDYAELTFALDEAARIDEMRSALPSGYRTAFLLLVGGVVILVSAVGIAVARRFTRRIDALVSGTREVRQGNLVARVALDGRDELAELAGAFNRMVEDLASDREQIAYLQRVGAWQDVARKLAHEIK